MASSSTVTSINGYQLQADLDNANSGFSKWGFATKDYCEYFIKELITPVYPMDSSTMSESMLARKRSECGAFEARYKRIYDSVNAVSGGILVRIIEFFRCNSRYYLITEKVEGTSLSMDRIAALSEDKKLLLLKTTARGFFNLHSVGFVHFDVKPSNIMIRLSDNGYPVAKIIDFDSGFFINENISDRELGGDLTYLAPETFLGIYGEEACINGKADIFALGLVFHEYYCGCLPYYDEAEYQYPYESVLDEKPLIVKKDKMPEALSNLIERMIDVDPAKRPTTEELIIELNAMTSAYVPATPPPVPPTPTPSGTTTSSKTGWFSQAGDL